MIKKGNYKTKGGDNALITQIHPEGIMSVDGLLITEQGEKFAFWSKSGAYFGIEGHKNSLVIEDKD